VTAEPSPQIPAWNQRLIKLLESTGFQYAITAVILLNAVVLGLKAGPDQGAGAPWILIKIDTVCLGIFIVELTLKLVAYRLQFFRSGWNVFDFVVIAIALLPDAGVWGVLRALRVLRVMRLLTVVPQMRRVVAAFLHAIPGLGGVVAVMAVFIYTAAVLATNLFSAEYPEFFGSVGASLFSLFQIMTLESWSMSIVRPLMETHPWAWVFFVPFIIVATFTILNLFIGIIVSTMQELHIGPDVTGNQAEIERTLSRIETDLQSLRQSLKRPPTK
jgi:voltage-gated sodium channel